MGAALMSGATMWPASAAQTVSHVTAPYAAAGRESHTSCRDPNVAPACQAAASADRATGRLDSSSAVDSGARGTVPRSAASWAGATINQAVDFGNASAATVTFFVRVNRAKVSRTSDGKAYAALEANAACDGCPFATNGYRPVNEPGDQTVNVTLVRGGGAQVGTAGVSLTTATTIDCDFCLTPAGTASAAAQAILTGVDVKLWGLGKPATPAITAPGTGSTMSHPAATDDHNASGTAEPGMSIQVLDGSRVVGDAIADEHGDWLAPVDLSSGKHTLRARAAGREGASMSSPCIVYVAS